MSSFQHYKQKNIYWPAVFAIGLSSALTAFGTSRLAAGLSGKHLRVVFAVVVIISGIRMLTESEAESQKKLELLSRPSTPGLIGIGLASGVISALAGVGGGVITIPMMYYFLKIPLKLTIGTSSATVDHHRLFLGGWLYLKWHGTWETCRSGVSGFVDLQRGIALIIGTLLLARVGAYVSFRTPPYRLRIMFALFIISLSIYMLFK